MPPVSVIISVYNGEKYLDAAIQSVLSQAHSPLELIIIDDGSQDNTVPIIKQYGSKLRFFPQLNRGQPAALNYGLSFAQGSYITFLDADDLYTPDKMAPQINFLETTPQVDCVFGYVEQFFSPDLSQEMRARLFCPPAPSQGYVAAAGLFRKECFERVGLFNEEQRIGAFIEWYMRAMEKELKSALIPNQVLRRRIHASNMGIYARDGRLEYVKIVKAALQRRLSSTR